MLEILICNTITSPQHWKGFALCTRELNTTMTSLSHSLLRNYSMKPTEKVDITFNVFHKGSDVKHADLTMRGTTSLTQLLTEGACNPVYDDVQDDAHLPLAPHEKMPLGTDLPVQESEETKKSVKFGGLVIREHKLLIASRSWTNGPPITLSWEQTQVQHVDLDDFERSREGGRRPSKDLWASADDRRIMLKEVGGYSDKDLLQAERLRKAISIPSRTFELRRKTSK